MKFLFYARPKAERFHSLSKSIVAVHIDENEKHIYLLPCTGKSEWAFRLYRLPDSCKYGYVFYAKFLEHLERIEIDDTFWMELL